MTSNSMNWRKKKSHLLPELNCRRSGAGLIHSYVEWIDSLKTNTGSWKKIGGVFCDLMFFVGLFKTLQYWFKIQVRLSGKVLPSSRVQWHSILIHVLLLVQIINNKMCYLYPNNIWKYYISRIYKKLKNIWVCQTLEKLKMHLYSVNLIFFIIFTDPSKNQTAAADLESCCSCTH